MGIENYSHDGRPAIAGVLYEGLQTTEVQQRVRPEPNRWARSLNAFEAELGVELRACQTEG